MSVNLRGSGVALITPMTEQGAVDYAALDRMVEHVIDGGMDYLVALGTTGEPITLDAEECRRVFDRILARVAGRVPVVAGMFGGNHTHALQQKIRAYNFDGFAAIMSSSPAYNKPTQAGIYEHYTRLADTAPLPILLYNVPGRTASTVEAETILRLAEQGAERFVGVKDATADLRLSMEVAAHKPADFQLLCGEDGMVLPFLAVGGEGAISVIANGFPRIFSRLVQAARGADLPTARALNAQLLPLDHWLYNENNPAGIKAVCEHLGLCTRHVRLPLLPYSTDNLPGLRAAADQILAAVSPR